MLHDHHIILNPVCSAHFIWTHTTHHTNFSILFQLICSVLPERVLVNVVVTYNDCFNVSCEWTTLVLDKFPALIVYLYHWCITSVVTFSMWEFTVALVVSGLNGKSMEQEMYCGCNVVKHDSYQLSLSKRLTESDRSAVHQHTTLFSHLTVTALRPVQRKR